MRDVYFINTKINFVNLEKLYNFVVEKFFIWIHLGTQKLIRKTNLPRAKKNTHGKMPLCRVPKQRHSANSIFAECQKKGTRQTESKLLVRGPKWFQIKMLPTTKFHTHLKIYKVYFGHLVIRHSGSNIIHKSYISLFDFHETNMRDTREM